MSNKTSDENVGSVEKDIRNIKQYINLVLNKGYCDCNELNVISTGKYCDGSKNVAYSMQNILAELEQKDKRIKELEKENKKYIVQLTDKQYRNLVETIRKEVKQEFEQKVIDKIDEYDKRMEEDAGHPNWVITDRIVMNVLQELLEGRNENV